MGISAKNKLILYELLVLIMIKFKMPGNINEIRVKLLPLKLPFHYCGI